MPLRYSRKPGTSPEALAARLPDELKRPNGFHNLDDFNAHADAVRAWANTQAPGLANDQLSPVMKAAGVSVADWYKVRLRDGNES